jgi:hypothetical protein
MRAKKRTWRGSAMVGVAVLVLAAPVLASTTSTAGAVVHRHAQPADTVVYPFSCQVVDLSSGVHTMTTNLTVTGTVPATAPRGSTVTLSDVSITIGPDIAYDLPSQGGLFNTVVTGLVLTMSSDAGTTPSSETSTDLSGQVSGPNGYTSPTTSMTFPVTGAAGTTVNFRPSSVTFDIFNVVFWDSFPPVYTCTPTSGPPVATTVVTDPLGPAIVSLAQDVQQRVSNDPWQSQHEALLAEIDADLRAPTTGAADRLAAGDETGAAPLLAQVQLDLRKATLSGASELAPDAAVLVQLLDVFGARSYQLGGLLSGCGASPSTCAASDLTSYHAAVADWQAGAWFQLTGHPVAAANQFEAAVVVAAALGG